MVDLKDRSGNGAFCRFQFINETCRTRITEASYLPDPRFDYTRTFDIPVTDELINHLENESLFVDVCLMAV